MADSRVRPALDLAWNPLVFTLGQVVMSAVLQIENYIPELQERFRRSGFPIYRRLETQELRFAPNMEAEFRNDSKWVFLNKAQTCLVSVGSRAVVIERSVYTSFEDFARDLEVAISIVRDVLEVELYERLGFRRVNLLEHREEISLEQLVKPGLHGMYPTENETFTAAPERRFEHWGPTNVGRMMVRFVSPVPELVLPDELAQTALAVRAPENRNSAATLDIDHFVVSQGEFDPEAITGAFWDLHAASDAAFRGAVTPGALEYWRTTSPPWSDSHADA